MGREGLAHQAAQAGGRLPLLGEEAHPHPIGQESLRDPLGGERLGAPLPQAAVP
jgi:hypothetical protein